ncbi:MAG TPA: universal stress protein [Puia sp.]|nr:universal stress protein [Puia sp.]
MNTIILPVDFSEASLNAVKYAAAMTCHRAVGRIILLHTAEVTAYDNISQVGWGELISDEWQRAASLLTERSKELIAGCPQGVKVQTATSEMPLLRAVHQLISDVGGGLVVVGVGAGAEDGTAGGQVIGLARTSSVPVLVVPRNCAYVRAREAVLMVRPGQDVAGLVDEEWLRAEFGTTAVSVYSVSGSDPIKGVLEHAEAIAAQLIVALPGRRSLFYRLTHRDLLKALARNTGFPVLLLK